MKKIMEKIKNKICPVMEHAASLAGRHAEKLSPRRKKIAVIIFCILSSLLSFYFIAKAFNGNGAKVFFMRPLTAPLHVGKNLEMPRSFISEDAYRKIELYKRYLDSISMADRKTFLQIVGERPGLMDSIGMFEKLYLSQSKK